MIHWAWCAALFAALLFGTPPTLVHADDATTTSAEAEKPAEKKKARKKKKRRRKKKRRKKSRKKGGRSAYRNMRDGWHAPPKPEDFPQVAEGQQPPLVFRTVGIDEPFVVPVLDDTGRMDEASLEIASRALAKKGIEPRPVHPRLMGLIYRAMRHFQAPYVTVVSGIRRSRRMSRHWHGLACDIVLPGVQDKQLAAYFRAQGFVGVGVYLRSGFVHIDVREKSYFWVDRSPRGKRWRTRPVRMEEAKAADAAALARGEEPFVAPDSMKRALRRRARLRAKRRKRRRNRKKSSKKSKKQREKAP